MPTCNHSREPLICDVAGLPVFPAVFVLVYGAADDFHGYEFAHAGQSATKLRGRRKSDPGGSAMDLDTLWHCIPCSLYTF